jgi:hypothetical protein
MKYQYILPIGLIGLLQACGTAPIKAFDAPTPPQAAAAGSNSPGLAPAPPSVGAAGPTQIADRQDVKPDRANSDRPEYCAPENYRQFFWHFVQDYDLQNHPMRAPYTAAEVKVRNYDDSAKILAVVKKPDYQGFKIRALDYTMVYDDPSITDPNAKARLKLDFKRRTEDIFRVDYVRAEFKVNPEAEDNNGELIRTYGAPGAYVFEHQNGCWQLTTEYRSQVSGTDRTAKPDPDSAPIAQPQAARSALNPQALAALLSEGVTGREFQKTVLKSGWVPLASANCQGQVGHAARICREQEDVNDCSADGHCMTFYEDQKTGVRLKVVTYGPEQRVKHWDFRKDGMPPR